MKLGPGTKLEKRKMTTSKNFDNYVMSVSWSLFSHTERQLFSVKCDRLLSRG